MLGLFQTEAYVLSTLYKMFGPLGVLSRLIGQFPLHATLCGDFLLLRFSWFSPATFYYFLTSLLPAASTIYEITSLQLVTSESIISDSFYSVTQLLIKLLCFLMSWEELFELFNNLEVFDSQLHRVPILINNTVQGKGVIWIICPLGHLLWAFCLEMTFNNKPVWNCIARSFSFIPHVLQTVLFCFVCTEVKNRMTRLQTSWLHYLQAATGYNVEKSTLRLDYYHTLHSNLLKCADSLSAAFGLKMAAICFSLFYSIIFFSFHVYTDKSTTLLLPEIFWFFLLMIWISHYSSILRKESYSMLDQSFHIRITELNDCLRTQMDLLVLQIHRGKVQVCIPGLIRFSKELIGSFVSVLIMYFILATQVAVPVRH